MPALTYSIADFQPFTKIKSSEVNTKFTEIQTLLNTTKLDDDNIQDDGITRSTKLAATTANTFQINDGSGDMADMSIIAGAVAAGDSSGNPVTSSAGTQGQLLQSNGSNTPTWVDSPFKTPSHYIKSGAVNSDGQPDFIRPDGGGADDLTILAASTDLVLVIEDSEYTLTADINVTGLDAPATTNNTSQLVNAQAGDDQWTQTIGEDGFDLEYDTGGANFLPTSGEGQLHAFKINDGASDEYFIGRFKMDATATSGNLQECLRGYFVDSSGAAIPRIGVTDNDVITIQKLYWVFVSSTGTATATDLEPIYRHDEPTSPSTGQMWFDLDARQWKRYNGASFDTVLELPIGMAVVDENDEATGARSFDFYTPTSTTNTVQLITNSATVVKGSANGVISVKGEIVRFPGGNPSWDITDTDVRVGTEDASTAYWCYITSSGELKLEATAPYRSNELQGHYHPHKPWRSVGVLYNDSSSDIVSISDYIQVRKQVKFLTSDVTASVNPISDLTYSGLIPGKVYEVQIKMNTTVNSSSAMQMDALNDSVTVSMVRMQSGSGSGISNTTRISSDTFRATDQSVTFSSTELGTGTILGNGTTAETYVRITEIPDRPENETDQW